MGQREKAREVLLDMTKFFSVKIVLFSVPISNVAECFLGTLPIECIVTLLDFCLSEV